MAGRYSKEELKEKLHRAAFELVAAEGIERITGRRVAAGAGLSEPYIYQCYADMPELLADAFMRIDGKIAGLMRGIVKKEAPHFQGRQNLEPICRKMWMAYWRFLMEDSAQTIFYWRFCQSAYYTKKLLEQHRANIRPLLTFIHMAGQKLALDEGINLDAMVSNIIDDTVSNAVKIHLDYMPQGSVSIQDIYRSVFSLLFYKLDLNISDTAVSDPCDGLEGW